MARRGRRLFAHLCIGVVVLAAAGTAGADNFPAWSGTKGPFQWHAKREGCGVVGRDPSTIHAHTRWKSSPKNGYVRLTFTRQIRESTGTWSTVQRQRRTTKNTGLEGERGIIHWTQWFFPFADEGGATSRHIVVFEWFRDRAGTDSRALRRERAFPACRVAPG
jgi:hypothetical protein